MPLSKFYAYKICAKREGDPFFKAKRPTTKFGSSECPMGYDECGLGGAKEQFCVPEGDLCPINDIIISESSGYIPKGYKTVPLDSGMVLAFTSKSTGLPTVRMKLTEGEV